jgi:hypothetical protein
MPEPSEPSDIPPPGQPQKQTSKQRDHSQASDRHPSQTEHEQPTSQSSQQPVKKLFQETEISEAKVIPNILETRGNETLYGSSGHDIFVYCPGDGLLRIEDNAGVNVLVLKQIHRDQIRVQIRTDGFLVVIYQRQPIVEMRGIDYIQTDQGVFPVEDWIVM